LPNPVPLIRNEIRPNYNFPYFEDLIKKETGQTNEIRPNYNFPYFEDLIKKETGQTIHEDQLLVYYYVDCESNRLFMGNLWMNRYQPIIQSIPKQKPAATSVGL
jgi:hypothetical protein